MNEAFTQYFAEKVCEAIGLPLSRNYGDQTAYAKGVPFVRELAEFYGEDFVYDFYFNGQTGRLLSEVRHALPARGSKKPPAPRPYAYTPPAALAEEEQG